MYPKDVIEALVKAEPSMGAVFAKNFGSSIHVSKQPSTLPPNAIEDWMLANEKQAGPVRAYLDFLRRAKSKFDDVASKMGCWNPDASHSLGHDRWSVGWAGETLLSIAACLYVLKSHNAPGCVLECGVFKGSSTVCLSWVCRELGMRLYSADSFEGLPSAEGHYGTGDFRGSLEEVRHNVDAHGCPENVEYIKGWYADSLKDFNHEIALLWVDVDLQQSALDVLNHVYPRLARNGVIFSDGFSEGVDFDGCKIRLTGGEPAGFYRYFEGNHIPYKAVPGGAKGLAFIVPNCGPDENVIFSASSFQYLTGRLFS